MDLTPDPLPRPDEVDRQLLSELVDGEAGAAALTDACARWHSDAQLRHRWHTYHLIGDVLRSEELAIDPRRDAAVLSSLRARLAQEPSIPVAVSVSRLHRTRAHWAWPVAAAAGLVAVVGGLLALDAPPGDAGGGPVLAGAAPSPATLHVVQGERGQELRDARIDEYLQAHRAMLAGSPAALPGGAMRNVELTVLPTR